MDRIEAAARKLCETRGQNYDDLPKLATYLQRKSAPEGTYADKQEARDDAADVLAAADAAVSGEDAALLDKFSTYAAGWKETLTARGEEVPSDVSEIGRLVELARRGAAVSVVPEGWKLVPVEPTEDMEDAAETELYRQTVTLGRMPSHSRIYAVMLSAAPQSPMLTEAEVRADERRKLEQAMRDRAAVEENSSFVMRQYEFAADAISKEGKP